MNHVYLRSEPNLWTVGYYQDKEWNPIQDCSSPQEAQYCVHVMNGGSLGPDSFGYEPQKGEFGYIEPPQATRNPAPELTLWMLVASVMVSEINLDAGLVNRHEPEPEATAEQKARIALTARELFTAYPIKLDLDFVRRIARKEDTAVDYALEHFRDLWLPLDQALQAYWETL